MKSALQYSAKRSYRVDQDKMKTSKLSRWWHTDCPTCRRWRVIILWALIMFVVVYFFWL